MAYSARDRYKKRNDVRGPEPILSDMGLSLERDMERDARIKAIEIARQNKLKRQSLETSVNAGDNRTTAYNRPQSMSVYGGLGTMPNPQTQGMNTAANGADIDYTTVNQTANKGWKGLPALNGSRASKKTVSQEESLAHATEVMKPYENNSKAMEILRRYSDLEDSQDRSGMLNFQSIAAYSGNFDNLANQFIKETGVSMDEFRKIAENYSYLKHNEQREEAKAKKKEQNAAVNIAQGIGEAAISPLTNYQAMIGAMQNPNDPELGRDYNSPFMRHLNAQEDTKEAFEAKTENLSPVAKTLANLGYDLAVTGTQSAAAALTGEVGLGSFAAGGYASNLEESDERGLTEGQAQVYSAVSGGLEYITERLPIEHLKKIYNGSAIGKSAAGSLKPYIKAALEQMGEEASEELINGIADTVADGLINGDKSKVNATIQNNISSGMSEDEATKSAYIGLVKDTGYSMLVAALSTGVSAGPALAGQARASAKAGRDIAKDNAYLTRDTNSPYYISEDRNAYVADEDYKQAQDARQTILNASEKVDKGQRISGKEARAVYEKAAKALESLNARRNVEAVKAEEGITNTSAEKEQVEYKAPAKTNEQIIEDIEFASTPYQLAQAIDQVTEDTDEIRELIKYKRQELEMYNFNSSDVDNAVTEKKAFEMGQRGEEVTEEQLNAIPEADRQKILEANNQAFNKSVLAEHPNAVVDKTTGKYFVPAEVKVEGADVVIVDSEGNAHTDYENPKINQAMSVVTKTSKDARGHITDQSIYQSTPQQAAYAVELALKSPEATSALIKTAVEAIYDSATVGHTSFEEFEKNSKGLFTKVDKTAAKFLYNAVAENARKSDARKTENTAGKKTSDKAVSDTLKEALSEETTALLEALSEKIGYNFVASTNKNARGSINPGTRQISIGTNSVDEVWSIVAHEAIGEYLQAHGNEADVLAIQDDMFKYLEGKLGSDAFNDLINQYQSVYRTGAKEGSVDYGKSRRAAANEMFNDTIFALLSSEEGVKDYVSWLNEGHEKSFFEKVKDFFSKLVQSIRDYIDNGSFNPAERAALEMDYDQAKTMRDRIFKAMDAAIATANYTDAAAKKNSITPENLERSSKYVNTDKLEDILIKPRKVIDATDSIYKEYANIIVSSKGQLNQKYNMIALDDVSEEYINLVKRASAGKIDLTGKHISLEGGKVYHELIGHQDEDKASTYHQKTYNESNLGEFVKAMYEPDFVEYVSDGDARDNRQIYAVEKDVSGHHVAVLAVGGKRNKSITPEMMLIFTDEKWNDFLKSGKSLGQLMYENDGSRNFTAEEIEFSKKNRVTAVRYESNDSSAFTSETVLRSPLVNSSLTSERDKSTDNLSKNDEKIVNDSRKSISVDSDGNSLSEKQQDTKTATESINIKKIDQDYMSAVKSNDIEKMKQLVEQAAHAAGYNSPLLYHGTQNFGFTSFDLDKMDDKQTIFLTSNNNIASTYSGTTKTKDISNGYQKDIKAIPAEKLADELNSVNPDDGMENHYEYFNNDSIDILKKNTLDEVKNLYAELPKLLDTIQEEKALKAIKKMREVQMLFSIEDVLEKENVKKDLSTALYMGVHHSKSLSEYAEKWDKLQQDIRKAYALLHKRNTSDNEFIVENYLDGYLFEVLTPTEARMTLKENVGRGNYSLYAKLGNCLFVNAGGRNWNQLAGPMEHIAVGEYLETTRDIAKYAKKHGYDSVVIKDVRDNGGRNHKIDYDEVADIYLLFNSNDVKSADPITYDDAGNIIPLSERFNTEEADLRKSIKVDSDGRSLSKDQQEYFKDSKVVDEEGRLRVVYHGTMAEFNIFDLKEARDTEDIEAFFFSGDYEESSGYGNVGEYYLNITNPANYDTAYDIFFKHKGKEHAGRLAREELQSMGYDGVIAVDEDSPEYTEYLVFDSNQIKRVDNKKPTESADIRYSIKIDDDQVYIHRGIEIVKNPTNSQYEQMREDILEERPWLRGTDEPLLRHTYDEDGNVYYWEALKAMHRDIEPVIRKHWNTRVAQNYEWWKDQDRYFWPQYYEERYSIKVYGEASPYADSINETKVISTMLGSMNNSLSQVDAFNVSNDAYMQIEKSILKKYNAQLEEGELAANVSFAFAYMQQNKLETNYDKMMNYLLNIGDEVIKNSNLKDPETEQLYNSAKDVVKKYTFKLSEADREEIKTAFGGNWKTAFGELQKAGIKLNNDKGVDIDTVFSQLQSEFLQSAGINLEKYDKPSEQILGLLDAMHALELTAYLWDGANSMDKALTVVADIINDYYSIATGQLASNVVKGTKKGKETVAAAINKEKDKLNQKFREYKANKTDEFNQIVAEKNRIIQEQQNQIRQQNEQMKKWNAELSDKDKQIQQAKVLTEKQMKQTAKLQAREAVESYRQREERARQIENIRKTGIRLIKWLNNPTDNQHVPKFLQKPLGEFLAAIDFLPKNAKADSKSTLTWQQRMQSLRDTLVEIRDEEAEGSDSAKAYFAQNMVAKDILNMMDDFLGKETWDEFTQSYIVTKRAAKKVSLLDAKELATLNKIMSALSASINNMNKTYANSVFKNIDDLAKGSYAEINALKKDKNRLNIVKHVISNFSISEKTPVYFFESLGKGAKSVFDELRQGWNVRTNHLRETAESIDAFKKANNINDSDTSKWSTHINDFELSEGKVSLTDAQIMSLYETMKRKQGRPHVVLGGIRPANSRVGMNYMHTNKAVHINAADYNKIISVLSDEQIRLADKLQQYMANECARWGNRVSKIMYGYDKFNEKDYFPLRTDAYSRGVTPASDNNVSYNAIKNMSAAKPIAPNASNAVMIDDIFTVFSDHVEQMANYDGFLLPLADAMRWFNYSEKVVTAIEEGSRVDVIANMQEAIDGALGEAGNNYFRVFIKNINGIYEGKGGDIQLANILASGYKAQKVMANLRVVAQQPMAIARAADRIEDKYLLQALAPTSIGYAKKAQQNSALAYWKAQGYYETMIGQSVKSVVTGQQTFRDKVNEFSGWAAGKSDDITWGVIYKAAELKISKTRPDLAYDSKEYTKAVVELFEDIIDHTQVVDTIFHKSQIMRSANPATKTLTAFMAEPTLTLNMTAYRIEEAYTEFRKGNSQKAARILGKLTRVLITNSLMVSFAQSLFDALRDDDEDAFIKKLLKYWFGISDEMTLKDVILSNFVDNLNPLNWIPVAKEIMSWLQGYDASNMYVDGIYSGLDSLKEIYEIAAGKSNKTVYGRIYTISKGISQASGIPLSNAVREVRTVHNNINDLWSGEDWLSTNKAVEKRQKTKETNRLSKVFETGDIGSIKSEITNTYNNAIADGKDESGAWGATRDMLKEQYLRQISEHPEDRAAINNRYTTLVSNTKHKVSGVYKNYTVDQAKKQYIDKWYESLDK